MTRVKGSRIFTWRKSKLVLCLGVVICFTGVVIGQEYEPIHTPINSATAAAAASSSPAHYSASASNSNSRTLGGGSYYNDPKSAPYYYPADTYSTYGSSYGGNALKRDSEPQASSSSYGVSGGDESEKDGDSGLYGLLGLFGLAGLIPALLPILGPLFGLLLLLLLPVLLPIIAPLLLILALPLLLLIAIPIALLFLPVPVVTVPTTGRDRTSSSSSTSSVTGGLDMETARMIFNAVGRDECIERYTCEVARMVKGVGVNTDRIYGFFLGKKQPPASPKWVHSIARGFKHSDNCKSYTCSTKLF